MQPTDSLEDLAATIRAWTPENVAPFLDDIGDRLVGVLRQELPELPDMELGAVLMVAADALSRANVARARTLSAEGVINQLSLVGERLYRGDAVGE